MTHRKPTAAFWIVVVCMSLSLLDALLHPWPNGSSNVVSGGLLLAVFAAMIYGMLLPIRRD